MKIFSLNPIPRFSKHLLKTLSLVVLASFTGNLSAAELGNLTPKQLEQKKNALVIDIRTAKEWHETGIIPDSHKLQFFDAQGKFDSSAWFNQLKQLKQSPEQAVILVCRSGNRSAIVGEFLSSNNGMENVFHLQDGISAWIRAGKELQK